MKRKRAPVKVVGLIEPGVGFGRLVGAKTWTAIFGLSPWRCDRGQVETERLNVLITGLSRKKCDALSIPQRQIRRMLVNLADKPAPGRNREARLVKMLRQVRSDAELNARIQQLQEPVSVVDRYFGEAYLNREMNRYEIDRDWHGEEIEIFLDLWKCEDEQALFRAAEAICKRLKLWDRRMRECAARKLLRVKNKGWLREGEKKLTFRQFTSRLTLDSITLRARGAVEFNYDEDEMFWDHYIMVWGTVSKGPKDATIMG